MRIECCVSQEVLVGGEWRQKCGIPLELAKVLIDGNEAGACNEWGGDGKYVGAGSHHVEVQDTENQRCFNYTEDVELPPGGKVAVSALLGPMPD